MAVAIRLRRDGNKDRPHYRIVVINKKNRRDGKYIESLGTYNPHQKNDNFKIDIDKAEKWLAYGAQPSDTVKSFIKKTKKKLKQNS